MAAFSSQQYFQNLPYRNHGASLIIIGSGISVKTTRLIELSWLMPQDFISIPHVMHWLTIIFWHDNNSISCQY